MPPVTVADGGHEHQPGQQTAAHAGDEDVGVSDGTHLLCGMEVGQAHAFHGSGRVAAVLGGQEVVDRHALIPLHVVQPSVGDTASVFA